MKAKLKFALLAAALVSTASPAVMVICDGACGADVGGGVSGGTSGGGSGTGWGSIGSTGSGGGGAGGSPFASFWDVQDMRWNFPEDRGQVWIPCGDSRGCQGPMVQITGNQESFHSITLDYWFPLGTWQSGYNFGIYYPKDEHMSPPENNKKKRCLDTCSTTKATEEAVCDYTAAQVSMGVDMAASIAWVLIRRGGSPPTPGPTPTEIFLFGQQAAAAYLGVCKGMASGRYASCVNGTCGGP